MPDEKDRRMDGAAGKLPVERADETFLFMRIAAKRRLCRNTGLFRSTLEHMRIRVRWNKRVTVEGAKGCRVNDTDKQDTGQHTRERRAGTT